MHRQAAFASAEGRGRGRGGAGKEERRGGKGFYPNISSENEGKLIEEINSCSFPAVFSLFSVINFRNTACQSGVLVAGAGTVRHKKKFDRRHPFISHKNNLFPKIVHVPQRHLLLVHPVQRQERPGQRDMRRGVSMGANVLERHVLVVAVAVAIVRCRSKSFGP